ncbi:DUF4328 domain-containing protein [Streptomyces sp. NBC_00358]|uniref:DUF4328 domain-containing protein n=1 Tax=Streptomyces sp. NBC_00358 TaxID=2975725 RepID=UPI002E26189A
MRGTASRPPAAPLPPFVPPHGHAWLRPPFVLGKAAAASLGLVIAADLFSIWADYGMYTASGAVADGASDDAVWLRVDRADSLYAAAGHVQLITLVVAAVAFLTWFLRVRVNAEVFSPFGHTFSRAWARWGWFAPFVNLWRPRRIMAEIWDASRPAGTRGGHGLVNTWWAFWIIRAVVGRLAATTTGRAGTAQAIQDAAVQDLFSDAVDIVSAVFAVLVVLKLTRMQDRKAHEGPVASGA